jgi:hypothetical protein
MHEPAAADEYRGSNRKTAGLAIWTLAWVASVALARFGPELLWAGQPVASWIAVGLNLVVGVAWIVAFARYLRAVDEVQRKIMLDALGITLGFGWVVGFGYVVAESAGLITADIELGLFPALLGVVFLIATLVGWVRFR